MNVFSSKSVSVNNRNAFLIKDKIHNLRNAPYAIEKMFIWSDRYMENHRVVNELFPASIRTIEGIQWGYINNIGQFVIPPQYEEVNVFQPNGLAIVWLNGRAGIIDQNGKFVVRPIYHSIYPFFEGLAFVFEDEKGYSVSNEKGEILNDKPYPFSYIGDFREQRAVIQEFVNRTEFLYGYLDSSGNIIIPPQYIYAHDFRDGKAIVGLKDGTSAIIGLDGEILTIYPFEQMGPLSEALISFRKTVRDKAGYVNEAGKVVIPPRFSYAGPFEKGRAIVNVSEDYKNEYGFIDKTGAYILEPKYHDIQLLGGERASVAKAIDPEYPQAGTIFALADTTTGVFLTDFSYDSMNEFEGKYSSVTKGISSFFINKNGRRALNLPVIHGVGTLSLIDHLIQAFVDERYSYFNRYGHLIWAQNSILPLNGSLFIHEGKYRPTKDYLVYYPQIVGMTDKEAQSKVNQVLRETSRVKELPKNEPLYYSYSGDFNVQFYKKHLLVLELTGYEYPFGAAHGMPSKINIPIDLNTSRIYALKDLFKPDSNYVNVLSEVIRKQIQQQEDSYINEEDYKGIVENQPFYVTKEELVIYFKPYEIAAYALGFPEFKISYQDIKSVINETGAFWRSFQ